MISGMLQRSGSEELDERQILDRLVTRFDTYQREAIVNYYIALKTKHFVILVGPPDVDKDSLAQGLADALVGRPSLQWSLMQGHPWWTARTRAPCQLAEAHARFSAMKLRDFIEAASMSDRLGLPFSFLAGIREMSPAEVVCYFEDLPCGLFWRADGTVSRIDLPANLFVTGTLSLRGDDAPVLSAEVHRHATVIELAREDCPLTATTGRSSRPNVAWQQTFIASGTRRADEAQAKLSRILPANGRPLAEIESLAHHLGLPQLPASVSSEVWLYLANAFDSDGRGLFVESPLLNLAIARDYAMTQSVLPLMGNQWIERPWVWETVGDYLSTGFPRAYAWWKACPTTP